jgi:AcrR family transcriptional regulator
MTARPSPPIAARKHPKQARSTQLVGDVLAAAVQVLRAEGAARFTTARVAERAGVSVGSLYQYFPNKRAILYRLQLDEWRETSMILGAIMRDRAFSPEERLRRVVAAFFRSECEEVALRSALAEAAPAFADAPEAREFRRESARILDDFWCELMPDLAPAERVRAGALIGMTVKALGEEISETPGAAADVDAIAGQASDMMLAYLATLQN